MSQSLSLHVYPAAAIEGGRISVQGRGFLLDAGLPIVRVDGQPARVVFASPSRIDVLVPPLSASGPVSVRVEGVDGDSWLRAGSVVATGLHQVDSPVVDHDGSLFVTYSGTRGQQAPVSIFRVGASGTRETFSSAVANPTSMAFDSEGRLFVSSRFEGAVYRLAPDGQAESFATELGVACGLAFAPDGTLFVGDRSGTVFAIDRAGRSRTFATLPPSIAAFHLALGPDALYVTGPTLAPNDAVYRITFDGNVEVFARGFGRPQGLAFGPDGHLYVVDALAGNSGLYRVDGADTEPMLVVAASGLIGVTFDRAGTMYVCTSDTAFRLPAAA